jgi:inhibitor of cysteine peptidase
MTKDAATLTEADNGRTVDVQVGDALLLRLPENATTGYRWSFDGLDTAIVSAHEGEYARSSEAVGSGGEVTWTLTALVAGTTTVRLKLWREWQGDSSIKKRFAVTLSVGP